VEPEEKAVAKLRSANTLLRYKRSGQLLGNAVFFIKLIPIICSSSTRRRSGHWLGTFRTGDTVSCPPPPQCVVSFTTSPLSLSLSLELVESRQLRRKIWEMAVIRQRREHKSWRISIFGSHYQATTGEDIASEKLSA
jgi:hypothetical protein